MKTKLSVWGTQEETIVGGFYLIGPEDRKSSHTAYVASLDDAKLYAAAPDLLEACQFIEDGYSSFNKRISDEAIKKIALSIKKAKGL